MRDAIDHGGNACALTLGVRIGRQHLFPERAQIGEMGREAEILLGDLEFHHQRRFRHRAEQRMEGLARLEIQRAVLDLHQHIVCKLTIQRHEFGIGLLHAVFGFFGRIDEGAPHHDAFMRGKRGGQHVRAFGMAALIILWAGLAFGVRFHEEAAEIRHMGIYLVHLSLPPGLHLGVAWIGCVEPAQFHRRREARGQIDPDPIGPENICEGCDLL